MKQTKIICAILITFALFYSGCSTSRNQSPDAFSGKAAPIATTSAPEPEAVEAPEVVVEVAAEPVPVQKEVVVEVVEKKPEPVVEMPKTLTILGYIKYVELEGGFFGIMTEDGTKYFPEYLEQDFKKDGLRVRLQAKPQEQILGIQMWGTPIEILKIEAN